jgi:hypothetical protein
MATSPPRSSVPSTWSPLRVVYERTLRYLNANLTQVHHGKLRNCLFLYFKNIFKKINFFYFLILSFFCILQTLKQTPFNFFLFLTVGADLLYCALCSWRYFFFLTWMSRSVYVYLSTNPTSSKVNDYISLQWSSY